MEKTSLSATSAEHLDRHTGSVVHVYETICIRGSPVSSKSVPLNEPCGLGNLPTAQEVADIVKVREDAVVVGRFGDAFGSAAYAVVNEETESGLLHVFLAVPSSDLPVLLAVEPNDSSADVAKMVKSSGKRSPQSQLCLLREGQVLSNASLADNGVQELNVLQWVKVEEKVMDVIHYQKPDVRRKFRPKVRNISNVDEILAALKDSVRESHLSVDFESHDLRLSSESALFRDPSYFPFIDVIGADGRWLSRQIDYRYFTLHVCPKEKQELIVRLTYWRGCKMNSRERKAVVILPLDSTVGNLRENVARFVSLKPGHAIRLSYQNGRMLRLSDEEKASSLEGIRNNCCSLSALLVPASLLCVDVESVSSGHKTSVVEYVYDWNSIAKLKISIASRLDTNPGLLHLEHKSMKMDEQCIIQDYGLKDKDKIQCRFYQRGVVLVLVLGISNWHQILVKDATKTTVGELQKWLQTILQTPAFIALYQNGRLLDSSHSLVEAGIAMKGRLTGLRLCNVNHIPEVAGSYRRIFEVGGQGVHGERFAFFPPGSSMPFYAPTGTLYNQLPTLPQDSVTESSACKVLFEGIQLLKSVTPESRSQECSPPRPSHEREEAEDYGAANEEMISLALSKREAQNQSGRDGEVSQAEAASLEQVNLPQMEGVGKTSKASRCSSLPAEQCFPGTGENDVANGSCMPTAALLQEEAILSSFGVKIHVCNESSPNTAGGGGCSTGAAVGAIGQHSDQHVLPAVQTRDDVETAQIQTPSQVATPCEPRNLQNKVPLKTHEALPTPIAEEGCHESTKSKTVNRPTGLNGLGDCKTSRMKPQEHQELENSCAPEGSDSHHDHSVDSGCFNPPYSNPMLDAGSQQQDPGACSSLLPTNQTLGQGELPPGENQDSYKRVNISSHQVMSVSSANNGDPELVVRSSFNQQVWSKGDMPVEHYLRQSSQGHSPPAGNTARSVFPLEAGSSSSNPSSPTERVPDQILKKVAEELGRDWNKVCLDLGVKNQDIEAIASHHPNDLFQQAFGGLKKWQQARGSQATKAVLRSCLEKNDLVSIAEMIPP